MHWKNNPPTGDVYSEAKLWFTPATQGRRWERLPAISAPQAYPSWIGKKLGLWARWEGRRPQPAPFRTWGGTGQHRHFPTPCRLFPHPLQNRVPRGERASVALCRAGLGSRLGWCWALPTGSGTRGSRRDQVLLSLPQNRRKHWVFAGFLFACVARLCGSRWFKVRLFAPGFIRSQPFPSPPPPKTHPASPFRALPGALRSFYPLLIREIPRIFALSLALEMIQDSVEHLNSGFRSRGGKRGKLRFFCRVAQMDHPFFSSRFWKPREYYA